MLDAAVRDFVETRFNDDGQSFYERFNANVPLLGDFVAFLKTKPGYKHILLAIGEIGKKGGDALYQVLKTPKGSGNLKGNFLVLRESVEKNDNSLFASEIRRVAFSLENLRKEASERFALEYDFSSLPNAREKSGDLERRMGRMSVRELSELVASPVARFELLEGVLRKNPEFYRKDWQAYLDALQSETGLSEKDRARLTKHLENADWISNVENAKNAFRTGNVSQDEIRTIIGLIASPKAKRALLRAVMPKISLGELVRMKIIGKSEAESHVENFVRDSWEKRSSEVSASLIRDAEMRAADSKEENAAAARDRILKDIVRSLDPNAVFVQTGELSDEAVDVALKKSNVAALLEEKVAAGMEELKNALDPEKSLEADRNGSFAVAFANKIVSEFSGHENETKNIAGVGIFMDSAKNPSGGEVILEGTLQEAPGSQAAKIRVKILEWKERSNPGERKMRVAFLDEYGAMAREDELSYEEFYRLVHRLENRAFYDGESMGRKIRIEDAGTKRKVAEMETAASDEEREEIAAQISAPEIRDLSELIEMFDDLDPNGTSHGFKAGMSVIFSKPESKEYNVVTVESVDEGAKTLTVVDTQSENNRRSTVSFSQFYSFARLFGAARSAGINSARKFLDAMNASLMKGYFEDLSVEDGEGGMKNFVPKNKRGQTGYEGVRVLYKPDGKAIQIGAMEEGRVEIRMLESFDPGNQKEGVKPKGEFSGPFQWYGYETLYMLTRKHGLGPYEGVAEEIQIKEPEFESKGTLKKFLNRPSFHDFLHGL